MSDAIVEILPLSAATGAIMAGAGRMGRMPTRLVACPVQVVAWQCEALKSSRLAGSTSPDFRLMGVLVICGAKDAQPELIWSIPVADMQIDRVVSK